MQLGGNTHAMANRTEVINLVKQARNNAQLTQGALAKAADVPPWAVAQFEAGKRVSVDKVNKLLSYLKLNTIDQWDPAPAKPRRRRANNVRPANARLAAAKETRPASAPQSSAITPLPKVDRAFVEVLKTLDSLQPADRKRVLGMISAYFE
jgi:DNA-binding XRE family transcriptional regulator